MKIKIKLFLLCAAVAPFLMMNSGQQNGSRFGGVCAFEKFPKSGIGSGENCNSSSQLSAKLIDIFNQNVKILEIYASENNTSDYIYLDEIIFLLAKDKGDSIESFKNKLEAKAVDWLDFCFLSAFLEGLLAARNQNFESIEPYFKKEFPKQFLSLFVASEQQFESMKSFFKDLSHTFDLEILLAARNQNFVSMEPYFKKKFPKDFPFAELKKLTCSMWTQIKSIRFNFIGFYHGLIYLMHCRESEFFYFIYCLAKVRLPYMQLFIACLMNFAYSRNTVVDWYDLINIMNKFPDRLDSVDGVKAILSYFHFDSKVKQALMNFYLRVLNQKDGYSAENHDRTLGCLVFLSCGCRENGFDMPNAINQLAENYLRLRRVEFCCDSKQVLFDFVECPDSSSN